MDLLTQIETELELDKATALKVFYFIQTREQNIIETVKNNLQTINI